MPHQGQENLDTFMIVLLSPNNKQREREREREYWSLCLLVPVNILQEVYSQVFQTSQA